MSDSQSDKRVFVTGGAGYIGTHTLVQLLSERHSVCVFDNYSNSSPLALDRVRRLVNHDFEQVEGDIRDEAKLTRVMKDFNPDVVIHFAGLKSVGEANLVPVKYYEHNVQGTIALLKAMDAARTRRIVFSSSATVYGSAQYLPYDEKHRLAPQNAYGRTKYFIEGILGDWAKSADDASAVLLRYFNPVGAHPSGLIGEDPNDIPNNLMPFISQVAIGRRDVLSIYGNDYDTRDGTGERDYIHVVDLAAAHLAAVNHACSSTGCEAINVGTGRGVTVLEMVAAFERASGRKIAYRIADRREGDVATSVADATKALRLLGWKARLGLDEMCASAWNWQSQNPRGYVQQGKAA
ncbi:MAG: UDP-glucose 4-epimerase GalE [Nitratireductor sp.]|nr:UDP-glucose 4-epimerase GalE [Nitratireductor sp.]